MMVKMLDSIKEQILKESLPTPDGDWEVMSGLLARHLRQKRIRKITLAALPVAAALAFIPFIHHNTTENEPATFVPTSIVADSGNHFPIETTEDEILTGVSHSVKHFVNVHNHMEVNGAHLTGPEDERIDISDVPADQTDMEEKPVEERHGNSSEKKKEYTEINEPYDSDWSFIEPANKRKRHISVLLSSTPTATGDKYIPALMRSTIAIVPSQESPSQGSMGEKGESGFGNGQTVDNNDPVKEVSVVECLSPGYEHSQPMTFGVSLSYNLTDRLAFSSGLDYSYCHSRILTPGQAAVGQNAHYLGIPLHIDWIPVNTRSLQFYVGAGGEARKCIKAVKGEEHISDPGILFSATGLAGIRYNPFKNVGIFVEPQYSYNFPAKSTTVHTAFTDNRNLFMVRAGVSINIK